MKAEIKKGLLILIPETKKEVKQFVKLVKQKGALAGIPASRDEYAYFYFEDIKIAYI